MNLFEELKSGKYNLVLFAILFFFVFHQYWINITNKEHMTNADINTQISEAVKKMYLIDVESIRNLSEVANKLQKEGLTIPGNLTVTGDIINKGNLHAKSNIIVGEKDKTNGAITVINKEGGSGLYLSSNHENQGGSIYFYAPANPEGKYQFQNHIHFNSSTLVTKGMVLAWSGDKAPEGWALCDGQNGTPDLKAKFILGWHPTGTKHAKVPGADYKNLGGQGGSEVHVLTVPELAKHSHSITGTVNWGGFGAGYDGGGNKISGNATIGETGESQPHNNMPPYYVLAYIIKL